MRLFAVLLVVAVGACSAVPVLQKTLTPLGRTGVLRGDVMLTPEQDQYFFGQPSSKGRTGLTNESQRWPNNTVPFAINPVFNFTDQAIIRKSLLSMERTICITFVERTTEEDYVYVTDEDPGCWSWIGRIGGAQELNLGLNCVQRVVVQHETIHALGFFHMQSAYERDEYVIIHWENIIPGMEHNFNRVNPNTTSQFNLPYDIFSIMHYVGTAFSVNGLDTMTAVSGDPLEYRYFMTDLDIQRINNMYCPAV